MTIEFPSTPASPETLMRQAILTSAEYLAGAIREIDAQFGSGYAQQHPELVSAFITSCALDFAAGQFTIVTDRALDQAFDLVERLRRK